MGTTFVGMENWKTGMETNFEAIQSPKLLSPSPLQLLNNLPQPANYCRQNELFSRKKSYISQTKAKHSFKKKTEEVEVVDLNQFNHLI